MLKKLFILSMFGFIPSISMAWVTGGAVAELRATATAGGLNAGWFDPAYPGTDFSQQDTYQSSGTTLASSNATGSPTCTVSAAGYGFGTTNWVGNGLHVTAGTSWTSTGRDSFHIILATATGSDLIITGPCGSTDVLSNGTFYIGGAISLNSTLDNDFFQSASSSTNSAANKFWIKNGSFTTGESIGTTLGSGGTQNNIVIEGYNTIRGDRPTGSNRPTINLAAFTFSTQPQWDVFNVIMTGTATNMFVASTAGKIVNSKFYNNSTTAGRVNVTTGGGGFFFNDEFVCTRGIALTMANANSDVRSSYIHDSDIGISASGTGAETIIDHNLFEHIVSTAIRLNATGSTLGDFAITNNTIHGFISSPVTYGITQPTGSSNGLRVIGNIFSNVAKAVSIIDNTMANIDDYNVYYSTTSGNANFPIGSHSMTINPQFSNVYEVSGTTATTTAGNHLVDTAATFQTWGITPGRDYVYLRSGTGTTNNTIYSISSVDSQTQITAGETLTANATADHSYLIGLGHDFRVGPNVWGTAFPGLLGSTTGYLDPGAFDHHDAPKAYAQ